ncbi:MAG: hypothetical protein FJZ58_03870 [Chlamydiae bacterium]|nr:hypothetical protein [Chlamydiota bacterium]
MRFKGRALYNSLMFGYEEDALEDVEPWQILDYRELTTEDLLEQLARVQISLTEESFLFYAEGCEGPEDLLICLWWSEEELPEQEAAYLVIFELWRRLLPTRRSLSIFADEFDHMIARYDEGQVGEEEMVELLFALEEILRQGRGQGLDPQQVFAMVSEYAAQDIEQFLYDYILGVLEREDGLLASTLIEMFEEYVPQKKWFDLLQIYLLISFDAEKALSAFCVLLEEEKERSEADIAFLEEVFIFLLCSEENSFLTQGLSALMSCLFIEQEREQFLEAVLDNCPSLGLESLQDPIESILQRGHPPLRPLTEQDREELGSFFLDRLLFL